MRIFGSACVTAAGALLWLLVNSSPVNAEPDLKKGFELAQRLCSKCHAIAAVGESPLPPAPPFRTLPNKWPLESLEEALAEGITVGHPEMPEFVLQPREIEDLLSYIKSLNPQ